MQNTPSLFQEPSPHIRNIAIDLVLTLITCGLFNSYVQYCQIKALNDMLGEDRYSFWRWALLTLVTCGLYFIYHEYRKTQDLVSLTGAENQHEELINVLLSLIGLHIVADAILQAHINRYYGSRKL